MAEGETQISENILEQRLQRSNSNVHDSDDGKDPFEDFEELDDGPSSTTSSAPSSKPPTPAPGATSGDNNNRNSIKFQDNDGADWDEGVDARDDDVFSAPAPEVAGSAYVKSKIQELTTVQEQVESTKDNPNILVALGSVLEALKKQIENAYDHAKIDEQDHQTLLDRLHSVHELIASK